MSNENIGLKNKKINQWSNGKQFGQEPDAEFPYIIVGAVVCKNIKINGFKTNLITRRILTKILMNGDSYNTLIFKLMDDKNI